MHTVISAFDNHSTAVHAFDRLRQAGFPKQDLHLHHGEELSHPYQPGGRQHLVPPHPQPDRGALKSFGAFVASLLGVDNPSGRVHSYAEVLRRGTAVLIVDTDSADEAHRAAQILDESGAMSIDEGTAGAGAGPDATAQARPGAARVFQRDSRLPLRERVAQGAERAMALDPARLVPRGTAADDPPAGIGAGASGQDRDRPS